jgi:hypothetical protein
MQNMEKNRYDFYSFCLKLAAFLNVLSLFLPWWSKFQILNRVHSDAFFFGLVSYFVDPPPIIFILPSGNASFEISFWSTTFMPLVVLWLLLICIGSYLLIKASSKAKILTTYSLFGFIFSLATLVSFAITVTAFSGFGSFMGAITLPSWQDWGPDIGFFLFSYSFTLSFIALLVQLNNRRLSKK